MSYVEWIVIITWQMGMDCMHIGLNADYFCSRKV